MIELSEVYWLSYAVTIRVYMLQILNISTSYSHSVVTISTNMLSLSLIMTTRYDKVLTSSATNDGGFHTTIAYSFILILKKSSSTGPIAIDW